MVVPLIINGGTVSIGNWIYNDGTAFVAGIDHQTRVDLRPSATHTRYKVTLVWLDLVLVIIQEQVQQR